MKTFSKQLLSLSLVILSLVVAGCGGGGGGGTVASVVDTTAARTGYVVQGPVGGATIFADNVASGSRFVLDVGEVVTTTDSATGRFQLSTLPSYDFILVSIGGTDRITNQPALLMLAPAGSANVTPLTTLVALDTTKSLRAKLEAMMNGTKFDTNVATSASPAILLLIKSAETAVQTVSELVKKKAADAGLTVTQAQLNHIQAQTWQQIALYLAGVTTANLTNPAGLELAMRSAVTNAISRITAEPANSNISAVSFTASSAATISGKAVQAALDALGGGLTITSTTPLSTTTVQAESSLLNPTTVFSLAITSAIGDATVVNSVVIVGSTPNPYSPAPLQVVTTTTATIISIITGSYGGTGGTGITF